MYLFKRKEDEMKKNFLKTLTYLGTFSTFFVLSMMFFSTTASAYIDPSAMTYLLQIVVGIIIAGGAAFGYYFKKIKRKMNQKSKPAETIQVDDQTTFDNDDEFSTSNIKENEKN